MIVDLIQTRTADGLRLDGVVRDSDSRTVWLLIHGTGSNFYAGGALQSFADDVWSAGYAVARVNTRGHDLISGSSSGAAFETISDCVADIRAWIETLIVRGFEQVVLVGHSMGALKALYSQACDPHPEVAGVVAISPPRFCHAEWQAAPQASAFREHFQIACDLIASNRGHELMRVQQPLPMWLTASGFVAKYGSHDDYDFARFLPQLSIPTLIVVGGLSIVASPAFASISRVVASVATPIVQLRVIDGADISYLATPHEPSRIALEWSNLRQATRHH